MPVIGEQLMKHKGFTLIELMMTIAIGAIILTLGIPSFMETIRSNRLTTRTNELLTSLNLARSEAIKRSTRITACKSSNGNSCVTTNAIDWSSGWLVFVDQNNNGEYDSASELLLKTQTNQVSNISMVGNGSVANYISYIATGQSRQVNGAFQAGTIKVCDDRIGNVGINLVLNNVGRVYTQRDIACP